MELNKIYRGDCLEVMKTFPDNSVDLIVIDPPYNIGKDTWDVINNYSVWMKEVVLELQRVLKDNGSFYMFHSEMPFLSEFMVWMNKRTNFVFRQFIVWNKRFEGSPMKGFLDGFVVPDMLRNYQQMAEYCLYYTFQDGSGLSKVNGSAVYLIRNYIRSEIERAKGKIVLKRVNEALGTATNGGGVASACLSLDKAEPAMFTKENYLKLRSWLNKEGEYDYLRKEYDDLRKEYDDLRFCFNNQKTHHSVWNYDIEKKQGHVTPKPLDLIKNILLHSSKEGSVVLDCFMGSGTTAVACQELNRNYVGVEMSEEYIGIANKRLNQKGLSEFT